MNKVEFVLTAEDSKAMAAAARLLKQVRETGKEFDKAGKKGTGAFDSVAGSVESMMLSVAGGMGVLSMVQQTLDTLKDKAEAVNREISAAGDSNKSFVQSFQNYIYNAPGRSDAEISQMREGLLNIASDFPLGEGGLGRITGAAGSLQSVMSGVPVNQQLGILRETAQSISAFNELDASSFTKGLGALVKAGGGDISANQAQNLLTAIQSQSYIDTATKVAQMIPQMSSAQDISGLDIPNFLGLGMWMTQAIGDETGDKTKTLLPTMMTKLMFNESEIQDKTGVRISGNAIERLDQLRGAYQGGRLTPDMMPKLFPAMGAEGSAGRAAVLKYFGEGYDEFQSIQAVMNRPNLLAGDYTADMITRQTSLIPGAEQLRSAMRSDSLREVALATNESLFSPAYESIQLSNMLKTEGYGDNEINIALSKYGRRRNNRYEPLEAEGFARASISANMIPGLGKLINFADERMIDLERIATRMSGERPGYRYSPKVMSKMQDIVGDIESGEREALGGGGTEKITNLLERILSATESKNIPRQSLPGAETR